MHLILKIISFVIQLYGYAGNCIIITAGNWVVPPGDGTTQAGVPSPGERIAVPESMNRDQHRVSVWCNLWGMKLNASKTKTMIVSRSRKVHPLLTH